MSTNKIEKTNICIEQSYNPLCPASKPTLETFVYPEKEAEFGIPVRNVSILSVSDVNERHDHIPERG